MHLHGIQELFKGLQIFAMDIAMANQLGTTGQQGVDELKLNSIHIN